MTNPTHGNNWPQHPPHSSLEPQRGNTAWWWVAGLAILVSAALIVWLMVSGPTTTEPTPTEPVATSTSADPSQEATPTESVEELWGDHPPLNIDTLKDLSEPNFPQQVQNYTLTSEMPHSVSYFVEYDDDDAYVALTANLLFSKYEYAKLVANWKAPAYIGGAVCGNPTTAPEITECAMAGTGQTLGVGTASQKVTMEDVAAFTEALYNQL